MKTKNKVQSPLHPNDREFEGQPIRAFLADDNPFMLALLVKLLSMDPRIIVVGSALDGRKALDSAAMMSPDLVLSDLQMPLVGGVEIARRLKQLRKPPIVFVVTSDDSLEALDKSLTAGADAFLVKGEDLGAQLQMALQDFFPDHREKEIQPVNERYEFITAE